MTVPDPDTLAATLRETSDEQGAQLLARLESDDIQAVLGQLPAEKAASVAAHLLAAFAIPMPPFPGSRKASAS